MRAGGACPRVRAGIIAAAPGDKPAGPAYAARMIAAPLLFVAFCSYGDGVPSAWGGVPLIDLTDEVDRQIVVDREARQYLGHVTTVRPGGGNVVFAAYPQGHGRGPIVLKRSDDGGRTWSDRLPVPENWADSKEVPTLHRVTDAAGAERLILWSGLFPARIAVSEDAGGTWSPLRDPSPGLPDWGGIVVMGSVVETGPGEHLGLFHDDGRFRGPGGRRTEAFTLLRTRSADGGRTWSTPVAFYASEDVHLCEPGAIRGPDGTLAILLRENRRRANSHVMFSDDHGESWTDPRELPAALTGDRHTAVRVPGADGEPDRFFISFRDTAADSPTRGDWVAWVGTWEDLVESRPGRYRVRLKDNLHRWDCAYPGVELLPDGTLLAVTYGHWDEGEAPYILAVRLRSGELDARAAAVAR